MASRAGILAKSLDSSAAALAAAATAAKDLAVRTGRAASNELRLGLSVANCDKAGDVPAV